MATRSSAKKNPLKIVGPAPTKAASAASTDTPVQTVVYIHGINNHPDEPQLKRIWDNTLFGHPMGERTRMAWWVDRTRYPVPPDDEDDGDQMERQTLASGVRSLGAGAQDPFLAVSSDPLIRSLTANAEEQEWLKRLDKEMQALSRRKGVGPASAPSAAGIDDWLWQGSSRLVTRLFLADVHDFFFDAERRERMRRIFRNRLMHAGPVVVVAHSQGTMIAYDVLRELKRSDVDVRLFVTCGSPLGLPPVRERFEAWTGKKKLPWPECVQRWVNVARPGDVVCADRTLNDEVASPAGKRVEDHDVEKRKNPHAIRGYLAESVLRTPVMDTVGSAFRQELAKRLVVAGDLVGAMEAGGEGDRFPVLIELAESTAPGAPVRSLDAARADVLDALKGVAESGDDVMGIDHAARFVSARLTRREIEHLREQLIRKGISLPVQRIWKNASKRALVSHSIDTIQARSAQQAYAALGRDIGVAVLDTGIDGTHPHFAMHRNIVSHIDCTKPKAPKVLEAGANSDGNGHGTHVAGIIAGEFTVASADPEKGEATRLAGMAPLAKIHAYKVLKDNGNGEDLFIIKALDHIARTNQEAGKNVIQVVNLSLGGPFDPSVFGCGHTPMCTELRRLWSQGVVVVIAAGNEGHQYLVTEEGYATQANLDLTIGDPANLEEAIAVGSVHRDRPHTYGISYFSSRGPTADGRVKPDVVAPGEKVLSARANESVVRKATRKAPDVDDLYVAMSGTSMAAPHVAGAVAAFLSIRREFIGHPERVKRLLMDHCTDLGRDRYFQGAGLINLTRMLAGS